MMMALILRYFVVALFYNYDDIYTQPSDKLKSITAYLRGEYFYCVWCGTTYQGINSEMKKCAYMLLVNCLLLFTDEEDMELNCPGDSGEAHE